MYTEEEYLMISGMQHFAFCRRQWALIHIDCVWQENRLTAEGELLHKNAHNDHFVEKRQGVLVTRGMKVASATLGMTGQCDVVEFIKAEDRDSFSDQYTAKIWSQRETTRLNKIAQQNASNSKWRVNASVEIYLAEPLADTALPDNPKVEEIIKQDYGPAYTVNLSYFELQNTSYDDVVRDMERITSNVTNNGIKNVNYNYSVTNSKGVIKRCKTTYDKPFDHSYNDIKDCLR